MSSRGSRMLPLALLLLVAVTGCTSSAPVTDVTPSVAVPVEPTGDGTLMIGTLSDSGTPAGIAEVAGVEVAVRELTELGRAGGLGGLASPPHAHPSASGDDRLDASAADLVARGVDVVIGPPSVAEVARVLPVFSAAAVPILSPDSTTDLPADPAVTAAGGTAFGLSPAPGADLAALAAELVESFGPASDEGSDVAVLALDESSAEALTEAFATVDLTVVSTGIVADAAAAPSAVGDVADGAAAVVLSLPSIEVAAATLVALQDAGVDPDSVWLTVGTSFDFTGTTAAGAVEGAHGSTRGTGSAAAFAARILASDPAVTDLAFAAEAYDAVIVAALAAVVAGDDGGASLAQRIPEVTSGGIPCASFAECLSVLETESDIAYTGPSGVSGLGSDPVLVTSGALYEAGGALAG